MLADISFVRPRSLSRRATIWTLENSIDPYFPITGEVLRPLPFKPHHHPGAKAQGSTEEEQDRKKEDTTGEGKKTAPYFLTYHNAIHEDMGLWTLAVWCIRNTLLGLVEAHYQNFSFKGIQAIELETSDEIYQESQIPS